jgi:hypothetical protein
MAESGESGRSGRSVRRLAAGLTALWLALVAVAAAAVPEVGAGFGGAGGTALAVLAVAVPVALIWALALMAEAVRALRAEAASLRAAIEASRGAASPGPAPETLRELTGTVDARLQELVAAQRRAERTLAAVAAQRPVPAAAGEAEAPGSVRPDRAEAPAARRAPPARGSAPVRAEAPGKPALAAAGAATEAAAGQGLFALTPEAGRAEPAVSVGDFLRALNFPDTATDADGFRALARALEDPRAARVVRAAQDVLTLLSEDGLYMDDLPPVPATPELWRRFARGTRGEPVAALGGITDPAALACAGRRLREDAVYRDAVHHFLRQFDRMLEGFEPNAADAELMRLADSRSARAFMLLGRAAGIFG